jgi:ribosomal protein L7/L12
MPNFTDILASQLDAGRPLEDALAELRAMGATPMEAIKAIRVARGVDLGEAKKIFSASPAWAREVEANRPLQEEAIALLARVSKP